ncbi:hypothetical protein FF124_17035 [Martelella lutilitoris]|uniref:Uncharacterized protein n=1 Tax=Martelella lutilitoris TaxID=2583532 RepID=A0A5C4JNC8_9HYPH|nr:hypothetical protein [Martelella lutilitoris]TNB46691.1 hypothetical protein FF124_17035 [Martelella lutilitoris]
MKTMIWVPVVLGAFKIGVLGTAMFFAIKSHRDGEKMQQQEREANAQLAHSQHAADASKSG